MPGSTDVDLPAGVAAIVGNGRSGTNWLLTMIDASPVTHCRSEPHDIPSSLIHELPSPSSADFAERLPGAWARFVSASRATIGERDLAPPAGKAHYRGWANRLGLTGLHRRPRVNRLRRRVLGRWYRAERPLSPLLGSPRRLREAPCVLKLNDFHAAHLAGLWAHDLDVPVVHLVRHPGGYLDSAMRRHFGALSPESLEEERDIYHGFLVDGLAAGLYPDDVVDGLDDDPLAAVMRFWSANNQAIVDLGAQSDRYLCVVYEEMAADPLATARRVYDHLGLPLDTPTLARIEAGTDQNVWRDLSGSSDETARRWFGRLSADHRLLVERELARTTMADWWT